MSKTKFTNAKTDYANFFMHLIFDVGLQNALWLVLITATIHAFRAFLFMIFD